MRLKRVVRPRPGIEKVVELARGDHGNAQFARRGTFDAPGASPTTTQYVFFDTEPGEVPPRATIASSASSRE